MWPQLALQVYKFQIWICFYSFYIYHKMMLDLLGQINRINFSCFPLIYSSSLTFFGFNLLLAFLILYNRNQEILINIAFILTNFIT